MADIVPDGVPDAASNRGSDGRVCAVVALPARTRSNIAGKNFF